MSETKYHNSKDKQPKKTGPVILKRDGGEITANVTGVSGGKAKLIIPGKSGRIVVEGEYHWREARTAKKVAKKSKKEVIKDDEA